MRTHSEDPEIGLVCAVLTYYSYAVLILFGHIRDFVGRLTGMSRYKEEKPKRGYSVLLKSKNTLEIVWKTNNISVEVSVLYIQLLKCSVLSNAGIKIEKLAKQILWDE